MTPSGISKSVTIADCHSNSVTLIVLHWISLSTWDLGLGEIRAISDSCCKHRVKTDFKCDIRVITDFTPHCNQFFALYPIKFTVGRSGHPKTHPLTDFAPYPIAV